MASADLEKAVDTVPGSEESGCGEMVSECSHGDV